MIFLSCVTSKCDKWPSKSIGHHFFTTLSLMHHFIAINKIKLELLSGNATFGSKSMIVCSVWPWNLTYDLENNRAPVLCYFKLYASFRSHQWIQTGVTIRKRPIWDKIGEFLCPVTLKFDGWPWKTIGTSPMPHQVVYNISSLFVNKTWSYSPETVK